jgi:hypothetical protein
MCRNGWSYSDYRQIEGVGGRKPYCRLFFIGRVTKKISGHLFEGGFFPDLRSYGLASVFSLAIPNLSMSS